MILVVVSQRWQCRVVFGAEGEALLVGHGPAVVHPARIVQEGPAGLALSTQQTENYHNIASISSHEKFPHFGTFCCSCETE